MHKNSFSHAAERLKPMNLPEKPTQKDVALGQSGVEVTIPGFGYHRNRARLLNGFEFKASPTITRRECALLAVRPNSRVHEQILTLARPALETLGQVIGLNAISYGPSQPWGSVGGKLFQRSSIKHHTIESLGK